MSYGGDKASTGSTSRSGTVISVRLLLLNHDAKIALKYEGGFEAWKASYGEFYDARYQLQADTRPLGSKDISFRSKVEIHAAFASESHTVAKYLTQASTNTVFRLTGYDTLTNTHVLAR